MLRNIIWEAMFNLKKREEGRDEGDKGKAEGEGRGQLNP
jgi:hypothetical protein